MANFFATLFPHTAEHRAPRAPAPTYTLQRLQRLYDDLSRFRESDLEKAGGGEEVVETVRQITEALVWGEQNDTNFFDFFCEKSILADLIRVLSLPKAPKSVKVQLLQTLSMLVQNIRRRTSLYYLLSNNYVNKLIMMPLDFQDEEIIAYYITFLKSLALRLDDETIKFFFIQHPEPNFPLYIEATKFFSHRDQMVRATVRTITLRVYPIDFLPMRLFVLRHATETYFSQLAYHLRDLWLRLGEAAASASKEDFGAMQHENDLQQDLLIYLSDVLELDIPELNEVLADRLLNCAMLPVFLNSIAAPGSELCVVPTTQRSAHRSAAGTLNRQALPVALQTRVLQPAVALFLLRQVFDTIRCRVLLEPLAQALLEPALPAAFACALPQPPPGAGVPPPDTALDGDLVRNVHCGHFLKFLRSQDDTHFLLAAAVVHSCFRNRPALSPAFLESVRILPPRVSAPSQQWTSFPLPPPELLGSAAADGRGAPPELPAEWPAEGPCGSPEVLRLLLRALQRSPAWQPDTLQALVRIVLDVSLDPSVCHSAESRSAVLRAVHSALRLCVQCVQGFFQEVLAGYEVDDTILDVLLEEWELHRAPWISVAEVCSNVHRLLPTQHPAHSSAAQASAARQSVRSLLLLRRLLADYDRYVTQVPREPPAVVQPPGHCLWAGPSNEPSPFQIEPELLGGFHEGMSFEIGSMERIVCGVLPANHTRYLLLHDFWLLLVQPDLSRADRAVVTTLWPIQLVQSLIDRSDPRTLRIGMQAHRPGASPGEAVASNPGGDCRRVYFTLTLNFEDVKRCRAANLHLQRRRQEVRVRLAHKAMSFLSACSTQPPPHVAI